MDFLGLFTSNSFKIRFTFRKETLEDILHIMTLMACFHSHTAQGIASIQSIKFSTSKNIHFRLGEQWAKGPCGGPPEGYDDVLGYGF